MIIALNTFLIDNTGISNRPATLRAVGVIRNKVDTFSAIFLLMAINVMAQVCIYSIYLPSFFAVNNATIHSWDYLYFSIHCMALYIGLRFFSTLPIAYLFIKKWPDYTKLAVAICESFFFVFTVADSFAYIDQGVHLYDSIVVRTLMNPNFMREVQLTAFTFITLAIAWGAILAFELGLWKLLNEKRILKNKTIPSAVLMLCLWGTSIAFNFRTFKEYLPKLGEVASLYPLFPLFRPSLAQEGPLVANYQYPAGPKLTNKKDVYLIMAESLRYDMASEQYMPNLLEFVSKRNCIVPKYHYSGGHTTEYGVFTTLYGLFGQHFHDFREQKLPPWGLKVLKDNGYKLKAATASQLAAWMGAGFMFETFDQYLEFKSETIYDDDRRMVNWALERIHERSDDQEKDPLFLFMFFNSTHHGYHYPKEFAKYTPALEENFNQFKLGGDLADYKKKVYNRYLNSVAWVDYNLGRLLSAFEEKNSKDSIVVFTGDHGEEFWEEGVLGHSKTNYINPRVRVPLFICEGQVAKTTPVHQKVDLSSHVDVIPTLISLLGGGRDSAQFNGHDLTDAHLNQKRPYIVITPPQFPYEKSKIAIITPETKMWLKKSDKSMHDLEVVRTTDMNDRNKKNNAILAQKAIKAFSRDAYKFLRPQVYGNSSLPRP